MPTPRDSGKLGIITLLLAVFGCVLPFQAIAQEISTRWENPRFLGYGWWQSVFVDRTGTAHIAWYGTKGGSSGADLFYYTARSLDGTWTPTTDVIHTGFGGATIRNSIAVASDGTLYALLRSGTDHAFVFVPSAEASNPAKWSTPEVFGAGYYLDLLIDSAGILHAVSSSGVFQLEQNAEVNNLEDNPCAFCGDLIYRRSVDSGRTWERVVNLSNSPEAGADRMDIYEGRSGRIYLDWDEGYDWYAGRGNALDVRLIFSDDHGSTWSDPIIFTGSSEIHKPIQISSTELRDDVWLVVWRYNTRIDSNIYYQVSEDKGKTWSDPQPIPGIRARDLNDTPLDDYELITDSSGVAHLFAVGRTDFDIADAPPSLLHTEFRQGQWRRPTIVYQGDSARAPEWPKAGIGPQNDIHLTWFIRYEPFKTPNRGIDKLQVFYAYRQPTLPQAVTQAFDPTRTPQPTGTADFVPNPTVTPYPTAAPLERAVRQATNDLYAIETLLSALFVCMVFCGGFYGLYRFWRR